MSWMFKKWTIPRHSYISSCSLVLIISKMLLRINTLVKEIHSDDLVNFNNIWKCVHYVVLHYLALYYSYLILIFCMYVKVKIITYFVYMILSLKKLFAKDLFFAYEKFWFRRKTGMVKISKAVVIKKIQEDVVEVSIRQFSIKNKL